MRHPYANSVCTACSTFAHVACTTIHVCLVLALPAFTHGAKRAVTLLRHTAWPRTWRLWRKTSSCKIKAVSSLVPLENQESCCFRSCWSATSSPRLLSSDGGSSPLRAKHMKTWCVGWFSSPLTLLEIHHVESDSVFSLPPGTRGGGLWEAWWLCCCLPGPWCWLLLPGNN